MEIGQKQLMGNCYFKQCGTVAVGNTLRSKLLMDFENTVWRETLEGANFGEMARKTSLAE